MKTISILLLALVGMTALTYALPANDDNDNFEEGKSIRRVLLLFACARLFRWNFSVYLPIGESCA